VRTKRIDLKKVDGERNPADLLTKHSISRQRLDDLVRVFGCRYLGGRAESAPQVRIGDSSRVTMAQADASINSATSSNGSGAPPAASEETSPLMPHLECPAKEIDQLYPSFTVPDEEDLEDLVKDESDCVYEYGKKLAEGIHVQSETDGRRRRPRDTTEGPLNLLHDYDHDYDDYYDHDHDQGDGGENLKGIQDLEGMLDPEDVDEAESAKRAKRVKKEDEPNRKTTAADREGPPFARGLYARAKEECLGGIAHGGISSRKFGKCNWKVGTISDSHCSCVCR